MIPILPSRLVPDRYLDAMFIAGGYAACPSLATDCDVWVTVSDQNLVQARQEFLDHAHQFYTITEEPLLYDMTFVTRAEMDYDIVGIDTVKVFRMPYVVEGRLLDIHLMVTDAGVDDVLAGFDISTHQCALTRRTFSGPERHVYKGPCWTPLEWEPQVIRMTNATPARLAKIRDRYTSFREGVSGI